MKLSIILSAIIVIAAALFGWQSQRQLDGLRTAHTKLVADAAALGINTDFQESATSSKGRHRAARPDTPTDAKAFATEFIAFARESEIFDDEGKKPDTASLKRILAYMDRLGTLDSAGMKIFLAEILGADGIKVEARDELVMLVLNTLHKKKPQAVLECITSSTDLLEIHPEIAPDLMSEVMSSWAMDDPLSALAWARANKKNHPTLITDGTMSQLFGGIAAKDPLFAMQSLDEMEPPEREHGLSGIVQAVKNAEQRTATLAALREYAKTYPDSEAMEQHIAELAFGDYGNQNTFRETSAWLASAKLSKEELETAMRSMSDRVNTDETAQWLEWLASNDLPEEVVKDRAYGLAAKWTEKDHQAAGKWLTSAPESLQKSAAVSAYAATVHRYDPETAMQWLQTLPPGAERTNTLKMMHKAMPRKTAAEKAAANAFAGDHGLNKGTD